MYATWRPSVGVLLLSLTLIVLVGATTPPVGGGTTPAPGGHAPPEDEHCGVCNVPDCAFDSFKWDSLTWFEHSCKDENDPQIQFCIEYVAFISHYKQPKEHEAETPYIIITIFMSFALGAISRHVLNNYLSGVPYTVVMFLIGLAWGGLSKVVPFLEGSVQISDMNPHLIFHVFLPVLIFESAFAMEIPVFKKVIWQCVLLATVGLVFCSILTAAVAKYAFTEYNWNWFACLLFGTILSATDPVAVVALLKELGASPIISTMIEGESLFNDGTAIVFFSLLVEAIQVKSCPMVDWSTCGDQCACTQLPEPDCELIHGAGEMLLTLLKVALGGPLVGLIVGGITVQSLNRVFNDALVEITLSLVAAYFTFYTCEVFFKVSGVLGVVACGCMLSYFRHAISPEVMHTLHEFWEIIVYLINTLIFILAGIITVLKALSTVTFTDVGYLLLIYGAIIVIRFIALGLFYMVNDFIFKEKMSKGSAVLVAWGGLRGAVGLALALIVQADQNVVFSSVREKFVFHVAGIVVLTLCLNGTTTSLIVAHYGLDEIEERKRKRMHDVWKNLMIEQREDLTDLGKQPLLYDTNWESVDVHADLRKELAQGFEDPYNKKGWYERRNQKSTEQEVLEKDRKEGKAAYLNAIGASLMKQYREGSLARKGVRNMFHDIERSKDAPSGELLHDDWTKTLIQAEWVETYFEEKYVETLITQVFPAGKLEKHVKSARWQNGFDVALGYISAHKVAAGKIGSLSERSVANQIETHCKKTRVGIVKILSDKTTSLPDISCSLKTRMACRSILTSMGQSVKNMAHEARLDGDDQAVLKSMIVRTEKKVSKRFPATLPYSEDVEVVDSLPWFQSGQKAKQKLNSALREGTNSFDLLLPGGTCLAKEPRLQEDVGIVVVVYGVVQIRVGRKVFNYGSGYTCYWQRFLTGHERFSDIWTESTVKLRVFKRGFLEGVLREDAQFYDAAWQECGNNATRFLMGIDDAYDSKVWDERRIRKTAERGTVQHLQDPKLYEHTAERRQTMAEGVHRVLLRGRCWEYGEEREHIGGQLTRFPAIIPAEFKFATFTGHAVVFEIEAETTASERAKVRWGRLKSKIKSFNIWSNLRGPGHGRVCLALAFGVMATHPHPDQEFAIVMAKLTEEERKLGGKLLAERQQMLHGGADDSKLSMSRWLGDQSLLLDKPAKPAEKAAEKAAVNWEDESAPPDDVSQLLGAEALDEPPVENTSSDSYDTAPPEGAPSVTLHGTGMGVAPATTHELERRQQQKALEQQQQQQQQHQQPQQQQQQPLASFGGPHQPAVHQQHVPSSLYSHPSQLSAHQPHPPANLGRGRAPLLPPPHMPQQLQQPQHTQHHSLTSAYRPQPGQPGPYGQPPQSAQHTQHGSPLGPHARPTLAPLSPSSFQQNPSVLQSILPSGGSPYGSPMQTRTAYTPEYPATNMLRSQDTVVSTPLTSQSQAGPSRFALPPPPNFQRILDSVTDDSRAGAPKQQDPKGISELLRNNPAVASDGAQAQSGRRASL